MPKIPFTSGPKLTLDAIQNEFSAMLDRLYHRGVNTPPLDGQDWAPPVELRDDGQCYRVIVEIPGIEPASIDVSVQPACVVIRGEKIAPNGEPDVVSTVIQSERRFGSFRRTIQLPAQVKPDQTQASLNSGLLEITCPKSRDSEPINVTINVETSE
jgi:HSP20 family protein